MDSRIRFATISLGAVAAIAITGGAVAVAGVAGAGPSARAMLRSADATTVGTISFNSHGSFTEVRVQLRLNPDTVATNAFHGLHIHANSDPANGAGCLADATKDPTTWFSAVDGHWKTEGQDHASHIGDLTSVYVSTNGQADARFTTSRLDRGALSGKALILHASADNFGNVPVGDAPNQYKPNSPDATTATKNTGNAGVRIACGVIGEK